MSDSFQLSRRNLLRTAAVGVGAGLLPRASSADVVSSYPANKWGTPGLYPARVVKIQHSGSSVGFAYQAQPVQQMIRTGLMKLTGAANYVTGWRQFVGPGEVVGRSHQARAPQGRCACGHVLFGHRLRSWGGNAPHG